MDKKSWNEIQHEEEKKVVDRDIFEMWKFFGEKVIKDVGASPDAKGWVENHQGGKKVYVWVGEDKDSNTNDAYDRAMDII